MRFNIRSYQVIKIPGKEFNDLSLKEVALMIQADSSLSPDGNKYFAACALDEFLHCAELKKPLLKKIRDEILSEIYIDREGAKYMDINTQFLIDYSNNLLKND